MLHFVDACEAERGCGAAALLEVIVTSSLDFVMVIVSSCALRRIGNDWRRRG